MKNCLRFVSLLAALPLMVTVTLLACSSSPSAAPGPAPAAPGKGNAVTIDLVAQKIAFDKKTVTVPAGASVTINFSNKDSGIPHNFALYNDRSASSAIFQGKTINGDATITYNFTAPAKPGTYFFRCDVHPRTVTGDFIVQ